MSGSCRYRMLDIADCHHLREVPAPAPALLTRWRVALGQTSRCHAHRHLRNYLVADSCAHVQHARMNAECAHQRSSATDTVPDARDCSQTPFFLYWHSSKLNFPSVTAMSTDTASTAEANNGKAPLAFFFGHQRGRLAKS
eukprot:scpid29784/ scgid14360/ 